MTKDSRQVRVDRLVKAATEHKRHADSLRIAAERTQDHDLANVHHRAALMADRKVEAIMDQAAAILAEPPAKRTTERLIERTR